MNKMDMILADHDDVKTHGTILYTNAKDLTNVYADIKCTTPVEGETLKDIFLKGCVVGIVKNGEVATFVKPTILYITETGYMLSVKLEEGEERVLVFEYTDKYDAPYNDRTYGGREHVEFGDTSVLVKVSDKVLTVDDLVGATVTIEKKNGDYTYEDLSSDAVMDGAMGGMPGVIAVLTAEELMIFSVYADTVPEMHLTKGTWFRVILDGNYRYSYHVKSVSCLVD